MANHPLTRDIRQLQVRRDDGSAPFQPGQYVSLGLWREGAWLQRPYSPAATSPGGQMELLVRRVDGGQLTSLLWRTSVGARVRLGPARGLFRLDEDDRRTHLFLATGTGIAPLVAMAGSLLARDDPPPIVVLHGVRHADDLAYRDRFAAWADDAPGFTYVPAVSRATPDDPHRGVLRGRVLDVLPSVWRRLALEPTSVIAYLCGNPAVVDGAAGWLARQGIAWSGIRREEYWPAG